MAALALGIFLILGSNACTSEPVSCRPLASSVLAVSASSGGFSAATSSPIRFCAVPNTVSTFTSWGTLVAWKPFSTACWAALDSLPTVLRCALYSLADRRPLPPHADTSRTTIAAVHETRRTTIARYPSSEQLFAARFEGHSQHWPSRASRSQALGGRRWCLVVRPNQAAHSRCQKEARLGQAYHREEAPAHTERRRDDSSDGHDITHRN